MTEPGPATERISVTAARWALGGATALLVGLASGATALLVVTSTTGADVPLDGPSSLPYAVTPGEPGAADVLLLPGSAATSTAGSAGATARDPLRALRGTPTPRQKTGKAERNGPSSPSSAGAAGSAGGDQPAPLGGGPSTDRPTAPPTDEAIEKPATKPTKPAEKPTQKATGKPTREPTEEPTKPTAEPKRTPESGTATPRTDGDGEIDERDDDQEDKDDKDPKSDKKDKDDADRRPDR